MESKECDAMSLSLQKPIQTNFDSDEVHGVAWSYLGLEYTAQQHTRVGWRRLKVEQPADLLHPSLYTLQDNLDKEYSPASRSVFKLISCECFLTKHWVRWSILRMTGCDVQDIVNVNNVNC